MHQDPEISHRSSTIHNLHTRAWRLEAGAHDLVPLVHAGGQHHGGGSVYADRSMPSAPTYAQEIPPPDYGEGLDGLLNFLSGKLGASSTASTPRNMGSASDSTLPARFFSAVTLAPGGQQAILQGADGPERPMPGQASWNGDGHPPWSTAEGRDLLLQVAERVLA